MGTLGKMLKLYTIVVKTNPGKREESQDSFQYPLGVYRLPEGYKYLETDYFLVKKQEKNL